MLRFPRGLLLLLLSAVLAAGETVTVTVLHTNDLHGALLPESDAETSGARGPARGGAARLSTAIAAEREAAEREGRGVVLLDAGDCFHGTPEGNETKGEAVIAWMNLARYDAMALGNHDWAYGDGTLGALAGMAKFPFVTCTVTRVDPKATVAAIVEYAKPWIVVRSGKLRVAVVGFTTAGTPDMNLPEHVKDLDFGPDYGPLGAFYLKRAKAEADVVIALTHLGSMSDGKLAEKAPGYDLIVGGHDHREFPKGFEKNGTLIVQAGCSGAWLGRVDLAYDTESRKVTSRVARLIAIDEAVKEDPGAAELVKRYVRAGMDQPAGATAGPVVRGQENPMGLLVADGIRMAADTDAAFINSGGVRNGLPAGPVTRRDLYMVAPFEDTLVVYELTGADLRTLLDGAFRDGRLEYPVSGLEFAVDSKKPAGQRILGLKVGGEPFDPAKTYTVATTRFAANRLAGDSAGRKILAPAGTPRAHRELATSLQEAILRRFEGNALVAPPEPGRVTFVQRR
ncbi:MAG: bifunctional metallophosphatase/5'-nucleotidase [Planctomycetia bacterium]|nr:bifunctional metallophosphatase/5'-nucleotidase [Planctomycetia bacterium]